MPINSLTTEVGLRVGPVVLETLIRHYLDRLRKDVQLDAKSTRLRHDELLYDEVFNVVKAFLLASSLHTVEDVQGFANTRTPSPPWIRVVRLVVPMSSCDGAASYLIKALGGEDVARRVVGGVKWWQVRGIKGVDAQWITAKKDWQEAKRRHKMQQKKANVNDSPPPDTLTDGVYEKDMDEMRCILYSHGGGYYFGSVDQERYSIQRHARKINGRVFAVNYRLAPQYPFPCALQDVLAAYLFLIRPPPGAAHSPVNPSHIIIAGDSAGGGISIALLQVIRDTGLPMPAGGVLISPWCDLTHSFPSVHTNTATDVIPSWGLSLQKPSILWPPPSDEISTRVHASLRSRIRQVFRMESDAHDPTATVLPECKVSTSSEIPDVGATASLPTSGSQSDQTISLVARSGETLIIDQQVHLYTQNSLLPHPLISPALSYLGGLPPLLVVASDKEVLRDEIIFAAHKAANPEKYPIKEEMRDLYPPLKGIESRYNATQVHLQVYDDTAHVLPVLFSFTTPAKFCFRAIATFCKHVTGMATTPTSPSNTSFSMPSLTPRSSSREQDVGKERSSIHHSSSPDINDMPGGEQHSHPSFSEKARISLRRSLSSKLYRATSVIRRGSASDLRTNDMKGSHHVPPLPHGGPHREISNTSSDVGGPRFRTASHCFQEVGDRTAGDPSVYGGVSESSWNGTMIRERVSTQGIIRPLEPESSLDAFQVPPDTIGLLSELTVRRYLEARSKFDKKFMSTIKTIDRRRRRNLERAKQDTVQNMSVLQNTLFREKHNTATSGTKHGAKEGLMTSSGSWSWAWALDGEERPPPSSIVSRRDTEEARRLARIADQSVLQDDHSLSGNHFWSVVVNFLTITPDRHSLTAPSPERRKSRFARLLSRIPTSSDGQ